MAADRADEGGAINATRGTRHAVATGVALLAAIGLLAASCAASDTTSERGQDGGPGATQPARPCDWPMWGVDPSRTFAYPCPTNLSTTTVKDLTERWFFNTYDVVTATPAVVDGTLYVGDWSGKFYALDAATGAQRWMVQADVHPQVYAGQIVSSASVNDVGGIRTVFFGSGQTMYALRADNGEVRWKRRIGSGGPDDFTEIESSPVVVEGKVIFGFDVHNQVGQRAGVYALDAATGDDVWYFDPDQGNPPSGCVDVWGSPSVDLTRRSVFFGTGSCDPGIQYWTPYTEAIVAIDLGSGQPKWKYQPHDPSTDDLDYAGAPNLFEADNRALVGLGNKDGSYYALDRDTGQLVWKTAASGPSATGGFIGPTAYSQGIIAGGTAFGPGPYLHGISAKDGKILWQEKSAQPSYAASAIANGVLFVGASDFTFRALDLQSGSVLWSQEVKGVVAGGAAIVGDDVFAVAGIREPGLDKRSETSGVYRFGLRRPGEATTTTGSTSTTAPSVGNLRLTNPPGSQPCIGSPCPVPFNLKPPPAGLTPSGTMEVTPDPFSVTARFSGLGSPQQWVDGGPAAAEGATVFGLFASESDDNPVGGLLCILGADESCAATTLPRLATYNRITLLALKDANSPPKGVADGVPRLITTMSFEPPLTPEPKG
ncbi:MAG: PQQ-binding-like beta-propeller repeat protein [Actinobacteria bacterium]|nr:PQQ-binding-like beta-propeller repeat protein [Actinomycetota bacterium]